VHAVIVPLPDKTLTEADILAYGSEHLAGYKIPRSVSFTDEIPRNASGKILKKILRQPFWAGRTSMV
jgi:long-chain acyl-CoA synthetase